jgi:prepilin-type N-terminal cleavage/methylation domain-containing protein
VKLNQRTTTRIITPTGASRCPTIVSQPGFTLTEVLVALALMAIGISAIASMFPAAMVLQQRTQDQIIAEKVANTASAIIQATTFDESSTTVKKDLSRLGQNKWSDATRNYPTGTSMPPSRFRWVAFVRDNPNDAVGPQVYVAVLKRTQNGTYGGARPRVPVMKGPVGVDLVNHPEIDGRAYWDSFEPPAGQLSNFSAGDQLLDNKGRLHTVLRVNEGSGSVTVNTPVRGMNEIWYAPPPDDGGPSPLQRVVAVPSSNLFE